MGNCRSGWGFGLILLCIQVAWSGPSRGVATRESIQDDTHLTQRVHELPGVTLAQSISGVSPQRISLSYTRVPFQHRFDLGPRSGENGVVYAPSSSTFDVSDSRRCR